MWFFLCHQFSIFWQLFCIWNQINMTGMVTESIKNFVNQPVGVVTRGCLWCKKCKPKNLCYWPDLGEEIAWEQQHRGHHLSPFKRSVVFLKTFWWPRQWRYHHILRTQHTLSKRAWYSSCFFQLLFFALTNFVLLFAVVQCLYSNCLRLTTNTTTLSRWRQR